MPEETKSPRGSFLRSSSKRADQAYVAQEQPIRSNMKKDGKQAANEKSKRVDFSTLEVFEFLIQIGDNPSCEGAPLCMSDECQKQQSFEVDEFEATRKVRRNRKQLVLSATKRSRL